MWQGRGGSRGVGGGEGRVQGSWETAKLMLCWYEDDYRDSPTSTPLISLVFKSFSKSSKSTLLK